MKNVISEPTARRWYIAQWPLLAWLETIIKLVALVIGVAALVGALSEGVFALPEGVRLAQVIVLAVLSLGLVAAIFDRLAEREVIAMIFVIVNNLGHWGTVVALTAPATPDWVPAAFCALMLVGDLVKLTFIRIHRFQVRDLPRAALYGLTLVYVAGYALILILELAR